MWNSTTTKVPSPKGNRHVILALTVLLVTVVLYLGTPLTRKLPSVYYVQNISHPETYIQPEIHIEKVEIVTTPTPENSRKVLLYTYMRSGSSFLGEIFNQNPEAFYVYEPYQGLYNAYYGNPFGWKPLDILFSNNGSIRTLGEQEVQFLTTTLNKMMNCDFSSLPIEGVVNNPMSDKSLKTKLYSKCLIQKVKDKGHFDQQKPENCAGILQNICPIYFESGNLDLCHKYIARYESSTFCTNNCRDQIDENSETNKLLTAIFQTTLNESAKDPYDSLFDQHRKCVNYAKQIFGRCVRFLEEKCRKSSIRVVKTIRLNLKTVARMIKDIPGLEVIYNIRDPRATSVSRMGASVLSNLAGFEDVMLENKYLCQRITADINELDNQNNKHIFANKIYIQRYEDIAAKPMDSSLSIYKHLKLDMPESIATWISSSTHAEKDDHEFGVKRRNSIATSLAWKKKISFSDAEIMTNDCVDVLRRFNYSSEPC